MSVLVVSGGPEGRCLHNLTSPRMHRTAAGVFPGAVTDVSDGGTTTGRPKSIKLSTANGHICYLCDSETAQVGSAAQV